MLLLGEVILHLMHAIFDIWHIAAVKYSIFLEVQFQKTVYSVKIVRILQS